MHTITFGRVITTLPQLIAIQKKLKRFPDMSLEALELNAQQRKQAVSKAGYIVTANDVARHVELLYGGRSAETVTYNDSPLFDVTLYVDKLSDADKIIMLDARHLIEDCEIAMKILKKRPMDSDARNSLFKFSTDLKNLKFCED